MFMLTICTNYVHCYATSFHDKYYIFMPISLWHVYTNFYKVKFLTFSLFTFYVKQERWLIFYWLKITHFPKSVYSGYCICRVGTNWAPTWQRSYAATKEYIWHRNKDYLGEATCWSSDWLYIEHFGQRGDQMSKNDKRYQFCSIKI